MSKLTYPQAIDWVLRNRKGLNQSDMAKEIGINKGNLTTYLNTRFPDRWHEDIIKFVEKKIKIN